MPPFEKQIVEVASTLPPLATVIEVADLLRVNPRTIKRYIASGRIRSVRADVGSSRVLSPRTEVERYLRGLVET